MESIILDTIQTLSYIFSRKNITICPFDVSYKQKKIKSEMEVIVIKELLLLLSQTLSKYEKKEKKQHKFFRYFKICLDAYDDNFDNGSIISQKKKVKEKIA